MGISKVNMLIGIILILLIGVNIVEGFTNEEINYCKNKCKAPTDINDKRASCHKINIDGKTEHLCHSYCKPGMKCLDDKCVSSCKFTRL